MRAHKRRHGDASPAGDVNCHEADLRQDPRQAHGIAVTRGLDHQGRELHARGSLGEPERGSRRGDALQGDGGERVLRWQEHGGEAQAGVRSVGSGNKGRCTRAESQDEDPGGGGKGPQVDAHRVASFKLLLVRSLSSYSNVTQPTYRTPRS